ncbi:hypothetical protein I4U23_016930 [Adineta vaga]|nr:hypothetical protein I4U23_016930 [Adineta vaga]
MLSNTTQISAFNCFHNNNTCEIFTKSLTIDSLSLMNNSISSVYFNSLPSDTVTLEITFTTKITSYSTEENSSAIITTDSPYMSVFPSFGNTWDCFNNSTTIGNKIFINGLYVKNGKTLTIGNTKNISAYVESNASVIISSAGTIILFIQSDGYAEIANIKEITVYLESKAKLVIS